MTNKLQTIDPLKKQAEVSDIERGDSELSPMGPPEAYNPPSNVKVEYAHMHVGLKALIDEHNELKENIAKFEVALKKMQQSRDYVSKLREEVYALLYYINQEFASHNKKEEKYLFPILSKRFLEVGEHSTTSSPITPVDVLEDEHRELTCLANELFYIWGLLGVLTDDSSFRYLSKDFFRKSFKLVEVIRLHIFREDDIVFSLAQKHLTEDELNLISNELRS